MINTRNELPAPKSPSSVLLRPAGGGLEKDGGSGLRGDLVLIMNPRRRAPWCNQVRYTEEWGQKNLTTGRRSLFSIYFYAPPNRWDRRRFSVVDPVKDPYRLDL